MDTNSWLWIAIIAFLIFCCLPMLFMGRRGKYPADETSKEEDAAKEADRSQG